MCRVFALFLLSLLPALFTPSAYALEVLATIRPLALIAHAVVLSPSQVKTLIPDSASAHHPVLRPSDRIALMQADLVLRVGPAHDAFLDKLLSSRQKTTLTAQRLSEIQLLTARSLHEDSSSHAEHQHSSATDPHLWLLPQNASVIAQALAQQLTKLDPANAAQYQQRANRFSQRIQALNTQLHRSTTTPYMAWHDAYQYLEPTLSLQFKGSLTLDADSRPGARHFQQMANRIQQEKISCLLTEPGFDPSLVQRVQGKRRLPHVAVDEMLTQAPLSQDGYIKGLQQVAEKITAACR
jgi:zinc transport system substrate-binding protein